MGYIVDHEIIKSWNMYKSIIYIKNGLHIGPLLGLNVVQYTKPLTSFKNAQGSPKNGLRRSAIAILRRYCRLKTDVKIIIYSRDLAGVSVTLWQRVTFLHLWHRFATYKGKTLLRRAGLHPFFGPSWSKKFTAFFDPLLWPRKNRCEQRTEKLLHAIFACPYFANKMISAALKSSAKNGLRPSHESACDLSANHADKNERGHNPLPILTRLLL